MRITLVNKSTFTGGAAVACFRLWQALKKLGLEIDLLVQEDKKQIKEVEETSQSFFSKRIDFLNFIIERIHFLRHEKSKEIRYNFSTAISGRDISNHKSIRECDIIHFHWFNQGFLSLSSIKKLINSDKKIIWTLHDMWAFTGGCHYSGKCQGFLKECGHCPFIKKPRLNDLSNRCHKKKKALYEQGSMVIVTCSEWLKNLAKQSSLLKNFKIISIPNPIDLDLFKPINKNACREKYKLPSNKKLILFGAANLNDKRKGLSYLVDAISIFTTLYPEEKDQVEMVVFGKSKHNLSEIVPLKVHQLPYIHSQNEICEVYNTADVFVLPSLQDNLPNTIMEALATGTPTLAFEIGGIPEMVIHKTTGFLAEKESADQLTEGLKWLLFESDAKTTSFNCRQYAVENYHPDLIAKKYMEVYKDLL